MCDQQPKNQSIAFQHPPVVSAWVSVVGKKEGRGPLGQSFDLVFQDPYFGQKTFEQAEKAMQQTALRRLLRKAEITADQLELVCSGDLLNQCIGSSHCLKNMGIPHLGLYGACSTMAEALILSAMAVAGGFRNNAAAMTSSHFCTAERQYRFPLNYGGQRPTVAQWTVTGAGAALLTKEGTGPRITGCTLGTVVDLGIKDSSNMGAAMAPSVVSTLKAHFRDFSRGPQDYDLIVTGDLGQLGSEILLTLCKEEGISLSQNLRDCGTMIFDNTKEDVGMGGSGCGCSGAVLCSSLLKEVSRGTIKRLLFCGTGALLSPLTSQQGLTIPGICHAVVIES